MTALSPLLPEIVLTGLGLAIFLAGLAVKGRGIFAGLAIAAAVLAAGLTLMPLCQGSAFGGMFIADRMSMLFKLLFLGTAVMTAALTMSYRKIEDEYAGEFFTLVLFATVGMMLMASAADLIVLYVGLELMSLCTYVLAGFLRDDPTSNEGALKYFLLGTFATAILLLGTAVLYGMTGTTELRAIATAITQNGLASNPLLAFGSLLVAVAFAFKIAAVPFHMWTPDAYEAAPTPVTAFMSIGPKAAAFAAFGRVFAEALLPAHAQPAAFLGAAAVLTMALGNLVAISQTNLKRMLAYSSIAHAGYILLGVVAGTGEGFDAIFTYLAIYLFMNMGAFAVMLSVEGGEEIGSYAGLAKRRPVVAAAMLVFLASLTGLPPTAGFIAKLNIFMAAIHAGHTALVILGVVFSVFSAYYYLRIAVLMFMHEPQQAVPDERATPVALGAAMAAGVVFILQMGLFPSLLLP